MAAVSVTIGSESTSTEEPMEADDQIVGNISEGARKEDVKDGPNSASSYDQTKETRQAFNGLKNAVLAATKALEDNYTTLKVKEETFYEISRKISSINFESSIKLNIGGHIYQTSLETLTKHAGSLLAEMFSASFNIKQSNDGSYFIDRDGTHFRHILNYLRSGEVPVPSVLKTDSEEILNEAEYYRLAGLVQAIKAKLNGDDEISCEDIKEADKSVGDGLVHIARNELSSTEEKLNSFLCVLDSNLKSLDKATSLYKEVSMKLPNVHFGENIKLDVGGRQFKTSLKTLRKEPQSILALMFSETFDLKKENDGSYFIDRDGFYFNLILNYLRDGKISDDVIEEYGAQIEKEAEFFGLSGLKEEIHNYSHVKMNIGGKDFVVSREMLEKHPDSMFGRMISGEECAFEKRHDGSYFVQRDATNFHHILDYLRLETISDAVYEKFGGKLLDDAIFYRLSGLQDQIHKFLSVCMNIGGKQYIVSRKVLNKFPESLFAKMLAGQEGEYAKRNDGSYYIDADPKIFHHILNYLRSETVPDGVIKKYGASLMDEAIFYMLPGLKVRINNYYNVKIDVGGKEFVISREVLKKFPESLFSKMLAGQKGEYVKRKDGSYFIDRNGYLFVYIYESLKSQEFPRHSMQMLREEAPFYGLSSYLPKDWI